MSHEVETMAFANETPWHGLGNPVSNDMTPQEMMVASGCDWEVAVSSNHYPPDHAHYPSMPIENSNFIERLSDGAILGEYVGTSSSSELLAIRFFLSLLYIFTRVLSDFS